MLNWSGPGLLSMNQKGAEHSILGESHLGKLQCISVKIVFENSGGGASRTSSEAKSVTCAIFQKRNLGLREMK